MSDTILGAPQATSRDVEVSDPTAILERVQGFLSSKDDTSRFVGLALLKSVLDNQASLRQDVVKLTAMWKALSPKFLDRLLHAGQNKNVSKEEATDMVNIAVAVLHTFTILLPVDVRDDKRLVGRAPALLKAMCDSSSETTVLILQTLLTFVSQRQGALQVVNKDDLSSLTEIAPKQAMALDVLSVAWSNVATESSEVAGVRLSMNKTVPKLLNSFQGTDAVTLASFIGATLPKLPPEIFHDGASEWLQPMVVLLQRLITNRPTPAGRSAYTHMAATILEVFPLESMPLIFGGDKATTSESKPFCYLFIMLLLIDIRSSFSTLLSKLNSPGYTESSSRLASAFDIITKFIGFLVISLDDKMKSLKPFTCNMPPDLVLKLRKEIAETMSLTIEYLRDRWDASVAGAAGLHPSARSGTTSTSGGTRLTLTWDSVDHGITTDGLVLASIRTLGIWLKEDENDNLRNECAGLTDMLLEVYQSESSDLLQKSPLLPPILSILQVLTATEAGYDEVLAHQGWEILSRYLFSIVDRMSTGEDESIEEVVLEGMGIIKVLLCVLDHESTSESREDWLGVVNFATSMKQFDAPDPLLMDLQIAVLQLATAVMDKASMGMQLRQVRSTAALRGFAAYLKPHVKHLVKNPPDYMDKETAKDIRESLNDVTLTLQNLT